MAERQHLQIFTNSLRNPLRTDVELQNPATLETRMSLARAYEKRLIDDEDKVRSMTKPIGSSKSANSIRGSLLGFNMASISMAPKGPPADTHTTTAVPALLGLKTPNSKFWCLTTEEMPDRRFKGRPCFNCPKKFSRDHASKCSMKGIYLLELDDGENGDHSSDEHVEI